MKAFLQWFRRVILRRKPWTPDHHEDYYAIPYKGEIRYHPTVKGMMRQAEARGVKIHSVEVRPVGVTVTAKTKAGFPWTFYSTGHLDAHIDRFRLAPVVEGLRPKLRENTAIKLFLSGR